MHAIFNFDNLAVLALLLLVLRLSLLAPIARMWEAAMYLSPVDGRPADLALQIAEAAVLLSASFQKSFK